MYFIANEFNKHFGEIGNKMSNDIQVHCLDHFYGINPVYHIKITKHINTLKIPRT